MPDIANVFGRHEFAVRRLHSLLGLLPVGVFLCIHLATNASILDGAESFQRRVDQIHGIGRTTLLGLEWVFILLPILAHGLIGAVIVLRGKRNVLRYPYRENFRYTLQRWTGVVALAFILWHVFHTRGWLPGQWWLDHVTRPLGGGTFDYRHAATAALSIRSSPVIGMAYLVGILACVYHLADGLWTMGITWGAWTSPAAQSRANWFALIIGLALAAIGLGALAGMEFAAIR